MQFHEYTRLLRKCINPKPTVEELLERIIKAASKVDLNDKKSFRQYQYNANFGYFASENLREIDENSLKDFFIALISINGTMNGNEAVMLIKSNFGDTISIESSDRVEKVAEELVKLFVDVVKLEISIYTKEQGKKNNSSTRKTLVEAVPQPVEKTEFMLIPCIQEEQTENVNNEATETDASNSTEEDTQPEPELRSKIYSCVLEILEHIDELLDYGESISKYLNSKPLSTLYSQCPEWSVYQESFRQYQKLNSNLRTYSALSSCNDLDEALRYSKKFKADSFWRCYHNRGLHPIHTIDEIEKYKNILINISKKLK